MPDRPRPEHRCKCGHALKRFWPFCPACSRPQIWRDIQFATGAECAACGWVVSDHASYCPWCSKPQSWSDEDLFEGVCPRCDRGVDDWMDACPWCGQDPTGRDLIEPAMREIRRLLRIAGIANWGFRVLLRPGGSGVDPKYPKIVEIERSHVLEPRRRGEVPWTMLVGLIAHELGHSFLFHHWRWTRTPKFRRVFGEVDKAYRAMDDHTVYFQRRKVSHAPPDHPSAYAATHPQEDFAETFRFYVTRQRRLRELFAELGRKRKGVKVFEKFLLLHDYVRSLRGWT